MRGLRIRGGAALIGPSDGRTGDPTTEGRLSIGVPGFRPAARPNQTWPVRGQTAMGGLYYVGREFYELMRQRSVASGARSLPGCATTPRSAATGRPGVERVADRYHRAAAATSGPAPAAPRAIEAPVQPRR